MENLHLHSHRPLPPLKKNDPTTDSSQSMIEPTHSIHMHNTCGFDYENELVREEQTFLQWDIFLI